MPPWTMPNSAFGLADARNSVRLRRAQRSDRRIDAAASSTVAGRPAISYGVHSSKTIAMSEFSARWTCIEISGVSSSRSPLIGEANRTPSSAILRIAPRLQTWKPPESVRIGPVQPLNRCRPPNRFRTSTPGRSHRWKVLPRMIFAPTASRSEGDIPLTAP